jgi:epsilon-lactone hydrolase
VFQGQILSRQGRGAEGNRNRVLINLHGGGFNSDSGSLIEGIPIANLAKTKVVSVYYRRAPENPFPPAVDDVVAVYKELLETMRGIAPALEATEPLRVECADLAMMIFRRRDSSVRLSFEQLYLTAGIVS